MWSGFVSLVPPVNTTDTNFSFLKEKVQPAETALKCCYCLNGTWKFENHR